MQHQAVKVRLYPTTEQQEILSQHFGCSRWWWNHALNLCIETYKATGKGLTQVALNKFLPHLKKEKETEWLSDVNDGIKTSKFANPRHLSLHERNLKRKQQKLARKEKGSKSRDKARILVARVHERVSNVRQDYLHKLSRKLVDDNQVIVVESLHVKGMVRNHKLAKAISDVGWGMFVNFLGYKLDRVGKILVEIDRWFPSSKLCSNCHYQIGELPLEVRAWNCHNCGTHHDRDGNAAINIRAEGIRMLSVLGTRTAADGGDVSPTARTKV
jgi:putative transposase